MRPSLQLKLSQHLALTPQLQQSIRLLQLSTLELNREIEEALQDNPLLERADPHELPEEGAAFIPGADFLKEPARSTEAEPATDARPESFEDFTWGAEFSGGAGHGLGPRDPNDEFDADANETQAAVEGLADHLLTQLALTPLAPRARALAGFIVEALDDDGYLTQTLEELATVLLNEQAQDSATLQAELADALRHVQSLDPVGVAARNARECLLLQLAALPASNAAELAGRIVDAHLDWLAQRDFARIKKALACDDDALRAAHALILTLDPRPGARYAALDTRYVIPDAVVRKVRGHWIASLNSDAMPRLRVNRLYADLLRKSRSSGGANLAGQLQEAKWLIKNVQQRFDTILRVTQAIVDQQIGFFEHGEVAMRPLTLHEIADVVGLHESTISRVTTQKYLSSPRGIYELKYFFGSHVATDAGGAASSTAIRALIKQVVGAEDGHKPLSDARIAAILGEQGFKVARRTVAKYRESMNIPPVNLRKIL